MEDCNVKRDLVRKSNGGLLYWGLPIAVIVLTGAWHGNHWIVTSAWTASLLVMGSACLVNASRCGRIHCYFTGPLFLALALASLLHGTGMLPLGIHGWDYIGGILLAGGVALYFVPEWLWGRYRRSRSGKSEC